jgi:hypothetical protein
MTGLIATTLAMLLMVPALPADKKKEERDFLELLHGLAGEYDNLSQAEDDHGGQHAPVLLTIKPLNLQALGRLVLLARETAANDKRRILSQRIWTLDHNKERGIVQQVYVFKDPQRWVNSLDNPEILEGLLPDDLQQLIGCELTWVKTASGYSASTRAKACRPSSEHEGMLVETAAELNGDDLTLIEQQAGVGGRLPAEVDPAASYHFQRRGG